MYRMEKRKDIIHNDIIQEAKKQNVHLMEFYTNFNCVL